MIYDHAYTTDTPQNVLKLTVARRNPSVSSQLCRRNPPPRSRIRPASRNSGQRPHSPSLTFLHPASSSPPPPPAPPSYVEYTHFTAFATRLVFTPLSNGVYYELLYLGKRNNLFKRSTENFSHFFFFIAVGRVSDEFRAARALVGERVKKI